MMELENVVARLADAVERRFYGKYRGFVVDNEDPERLGRLKVTVPSLLGDGVVTGWAMPCAPYGGKPDRGVFFVPESGAGVWIEFEEGDLEFPIWVGTFWSRPDGERQTPKPNDADGEVADEVQKPPTRKILKSAAGHTIQFEDADEEVRIIIADGQNENRILLGKGGLKIVSKNNRITMSSAGIVIEDANGNTVTQDGGGTVIEDGNGNTITMSATGGFVGPGIDLNGGDRVCLEGLITWLLGHQHIGNMGAPTPLSPGNVPDLVNAMAGLGDILSTTVKAK